jgi:type IV pilus biogenesis protein CpaD/CtpE
MYRQVKNTLSISLLCLALPLAGCATDTMFADDTPVPYGGSKMHPIKVQNGRASVENCGEWPNNIADTESNQMNANHGCAVQSNIAAMAAYPSDLIGKRRKLPKPLGDIHYQAIRKITTPADGGAAGNAAADPARSP